MTSFRSKAATHLPAFMYPEKEHMTPQQNKRGENTLKIYIGAKECKGSLKENHKLSYI